MARWQRPVRLVLGLFAIVFAVVVYLQIGKRQKASDRGVQTRTDPDAVVESTKGQSFFFKSAKQDIRIDYERLLTYQSGRSKFFGAKVAILDRAGRNFEILANEAEVAENQSQIDLRGSVVLTTSDKLTVKSEHAVYTQSDEVVRVPGPVAFARERMQGTSVGASYDRLRDVLWLLDQARITVAPDPKGQGGVAVTAGAAGYARRDRYIRFERTVHLVRGNQTVDADGAVAYLKQDSDELEMIELRGHSRVTGIGTGANGLEAMTARDINLRYQPDGQTIQQATLIGESVLQLAGGDGKPGQRLAAQAIDIQLAPDGQTVQTLSGQDNVQLDMPPQGNGPARQIRCVSLEAAGEAGKPGLQRAQFSENVEFRETQPATKTAAAVQRVVKSKTLETKLESGLSSIDEATFTGGVTIQDGPRTASGPSMLYSVTKGAIALYGPPDAERTFVQVTDERVNIEAKRLDWTIDGTRMVADAKVKSVLKGQAAGSGPNAGNVKRPSMLAGDQPVNVTANHLLYNRESGKADYTGESQLWQGQTSIKADNISLDEQSGNLAASGNVRSVMRMEETAEGSAGKSKDGSTPAGKPAAAPPAPAQTTKPGAAPAGGSAAAGTAKPGGTTRRAADTIATAADLVYDDAQRRATYTGTARVLGEQGDLRAERIELFFDQSGKGLERLEAYEKIRFKLPPRPDGAPRWGTGARLSYFAADERYVLGGAPAHVVEQLPGDCRQTTGRTLTFFQATDSFMVDSNAQGRTQTRTGGACPELVP